MHKSEARRKFAIFGIWEKVTVVHTVSETVSYGPRERAENDPRPEFYVQQERAGGCSGSSACPAAGSLGT